MPACRRRDAVATAGTYGFGFVIFALLLLDFVPRFYQGDSIAYLATGTGDWIPPDRSWAFGFLVAVLWHKTHGFSAFLLIEAAVLALMIGAARQFFRDFPHWRIVYAFTAVVLCLDPLIELYTRFFMSDFLAAACFFLLLLGLHLLIKPESRRSVLGLGLSMIFVGGITAIFLRTAYAPIQELTILFLGLFSFARLSGARRLLLGLAACVPPIAIGLLVLANGFVFAYRFPHEHFALKLSGVALAANYAPALRPEDFARVGISLTPAEFEGLDLGDYDNRAKQIWGHTANDLQELLRQKLGVTEEYSAKIDAAALGLVESAFRRAPWSIARVYLHIGGSYFSISEWRGGVEDETGLSRPLPPDFVAFFNADSDQKIDLGIAQRNSLLIRAYRVAAGVYPMQFLAGLAAALFLLVRERARPGVLVLCAALVADLVAAPLYSVAMVPRYILAAIFLSYLLLGLAALSALRIRFGWRSRPIAQDV